MEFIDSQRIRIQSGNGGSGMVSFRSACNLPKLGADGGDGGHGGHVYLRGDCRLNTLSRLYYNRLYAAEHGGKGGTNGKTGANGTDLIIDVPLGTIAIDASTGQIKCEVLEDQKPYLVASGGRRGLGNQRFLSATHQAPEEYSKGGSGEELSLDLELKLIADVGFAGFPNAGKSTLLSCISNARPKIADYPFTTLIPHLGIVEMGGLVDLFGASFVAADIPGLIPGASEGRGLGHEFLKHLERTKVIAYVIDPFNPDGISAVESFRQLRNELKAYSLSLHQKPGLIVLTKSDLLEGYPASQRKGHKLQLQEVHQVAADEGFEIISISSAQMNGLDSLRLKLYELVRSHKPYILSVDSTLDQCNQSDPNNHINSLSDYSFLRVSQVNRTYGISWQ